MPRFRVHADYDRDGRIGRSTSEQNRRGQEPGALLAPNIDTDDAGRSVIGGVRRRLDRDLSRKTRRDNDLGRLIIEVEAGTESSPETALLMIDDDDARRLRVIDARRTTRLGLDTNAGRVLRSTVIAFSRGREEWSIEAIAVNGSPIRFGAGVNQLVIEQVPSPSDPIQMTLLHRDTQGRTTSEDTLLFSVSPFLLPDNGWTAREILIAEFPSNRANEPTLSELRSVVRRRRINARIRLVDVQATANGDAWLQDQMLQGYFETPERILHAIVNLPRLARNALPGSAGNLARFVSMELPNRDRGLVQDFHDRTFRVVLHDGNVRDLSYTESHEVVRLVEELAVFEGRLEFWAEEVSVQVPPALSQFELGARMTAAIRLLTEIETAMEAQESFPTGLRDGVLRSLRAVRDRLQARIGEFGGILTLVLDSGIVLRVTATRVESLLDSLLEEHNGYNLGGNIETAPPSPEHPLGRIVIGSQDEMLRTLVVFLEEQQAQPLFSVDTTWLRVGHVDEILCFAPRPGGHCALIASPDTALRILDSALAVHASGRSRGASSVDVDDPTYVPKEGQHPISRLMRGGYWLHIDDGVAPAVEPPKIYRLLIDDLRGVSTRTSRPYRPGPAPEQFYPAAIEVPELLAKAWDWNANLGANQERMLAQQLSREFVSVPILRLPVLFDLPERSKTIAFTPDLVNCQILNSVVVLPRPYGPRVPIASVAPILGPVLPTFAARFLTEARLRAARLDRFDAWLNSAFATVPHSLDSMQHQFSDLTAFLGQPLGLSVDEFRRRFLAENQRAFIRDGAQWRLRDGWHQLRIPEPSVDLFEAYCFALLSWMGVPLEFVDTWFYHVRDGGLHCGTNVQRQPPRTRPRWWRPRP